MHWSLLFTPPNLLTLLRLPLGVAFALLDGTRERAAILGIASATDVLDGWLARRGQGATQVGALLDPIADKAFMLVALSTFLVSGDLSVGEFLIVLSRDIATMVGFIVAWVTPGLRTSGFRARGFGKTVTILQVVVLFALLLAPSSLRLVIPMIAAASVAAILDYTMALARSRSR